MSFNNVIPGWLLRDIAERGDEINMVDGVLLTTHGRAGCAGSSCVIHNPSDHHMASWRRHYRSDRGLMERICVHGVGHPDPDDLAFKASTRGDDFARVEGIHGCDGCCQRKVIKGQVVKDQKELTA